MLLPEKVRLCEVGLRDGLQSAKRRLSAAEKAQLVDAAADAGFSCIEFGAFCTAPSMALMDDTDQVYKLIHLREGVEYRALVYEGDDIRRAAAVGVKKVKINISASETHHKAGTGKTPEEAMAGLEECARAAAQTGLELAGSISMPFVSPWEEISFEWVMELIRRFLSIGVTEISLSDAGGLADPGIVYQRVVAYRHLFPQVSWMLHLHNTRGMGLANAFAGLQAGVTKFDASFAGLGGCPYCVGATGNVASEDMAHMMARLGIETGLDLEKLIALARRVQKMNLGVTESANLRCALASEGEI